MAKRKEGREFQGLIPLVPCSHIYSCDCSIHLYMDLIKEDKLTQNVTYIFTPMETSIKYLFNELVPKQFIYMGPIC